MLFLSYANIPKESRPWFYKINEKIKDSDLLARYEKNRLHGIPDFIKETLGDIKVTSKKERFCFYIPEEGSNYVHENTNPNELSIEPKNLNFENYKIIHNNQSENVNKINQKNNNMIQMNNCQNYPINQYQNNPNTKVEHQLNENQISININNINNQPINNIINQQNIPQNQKEQLILKQIQENKIGNIIIRDGKAYYLNQPKINNYTENNNPNIIQNLNNNNQAINQMANNNQAQYENIQIRNNQNVNYINNNENIPNNLNNNKLPMDSQKKERQISYGEKETPQDTDQIKKEQESQQQAKINKPPPLRNRPINKRGRIPRTNRLLSKIKDTNVHKPTMQYKVQRNRPVYAVPPSKKRSMSQGKPFNLIHKYYDENYILEDDEEEFSKNEEIHNIQIAQNISDEEENN